jgi:hypothetical protein
LSQLLSKKVETSTEIKKTVEVKKIFPNKFASKNTSVTKESLSVVTAPVSEVKTLRSIFGRLSGAAKGQEIVAQTTLRSSVLKKLSKR